MQYNPMPFVAEELLVTNHTGGMLFLSRSVQTPGPGAKDVTVPPGVVYPVYGWQSDRLFINGDGTAIAATDCVCVQASDSPLGLAAAGIPSAGGGAGGVKSVQQIVFSFNINAAGPNIGQGQVSVAINAVGPNAYIILNGTRYPGGTISSAMDMLTAGVRLTTTTLATAWLFFHIVTGAPVDNHIDVLATVIDIN